MTYDFCAECLADVCVCAALEAMSVLRTMPGTATMLERAEILSRFETEWQIYREQSRAMIDDHERVITIRDSRLT